MTIPPPLQTGQNRTAQTDFSLSACPVWGLYKSRMKWVKKWVMKWVIVQSRAGRQPPFGSRVAEALRSGPIRFGLGEV